MIYGQNPKYQKQWAFGRKVPNRDVSNDYSMVSNHNRSRAQIIGVGENPLNRNGLPVTSNDDGEEIV